MKLEPREFLSWLKGQQGCDYYLRSTPCGCPVAAWIEDTTGQKMAVHPSVIRDIITDESFANPDWLADFVSRIDRVSDDDAYRCYKEDGWQYDRNWYYDHVRPDECARVLEIVLNDYDL